MTTEKFFTFDLQRFDGEATVSASSGNVSVSSDYAFSGSEASEVSSAVDIVAYDSDSATVTSIADEAWIKSGSATKGAILEGIGTIASFGESGSFEVTAGGNTLRLAGVSGDTLSIYSASDAVRQTINGATVAFTVSSGEVIDIYGNTEADAVTLTSANATLGSITGEQTWIVNTNDNLAYSGIQYTAIGDAATITGDSSINAEISDGNSVSVAAVGSGKATDLISVNDTVINGAVNSGSKVTADGDNLVVKTSTAGNITVGSDSASLAAGASATLTADGDAAIISAVNSLAAGGKWLTSADSVALGTQEWSFSNEGSTLVADSLGTSAATVSFGGTATLATAAKKFNVSNLNVNKAATWGLTGTTGEENAVFDTSGNVTLSGESMTASLNSGSASLSAGSDVLNLANGGTASIANSSVVSVSALANGGVWNVGDTSAQVGNGVSMQAWEFENSGAVLSARNTDGARIGTVSGFSGNATLTYGSSISPESLTVGDTTWTTIKNAYDSAVIFDETGAATISAENIDDDDLAQVFGLAGANLKVNGVGGATAAMASVNAVYVAYSDDSNGLDFVLENRGTNAGISEINDVDTGAKITVYGDNSYSINGAYTFSNTSGYAELDLEDSKLVVNGVMSKENVSVTGGNVDYSFDEGTAVNVTLNGVAATIGSADNTSNVTISGSGSDVISAVTLKAGDSLTTGNSDRNFTMYYDASGVSSSERYVLTANDTKISVYGSQFTGSTATVMVDGSGSTPHVTIDGIANNTTLSVSGGVYNIGKAAQVTVNEDTGYITIDGAGNTTAEDESAADSRRQREDSINNALDNASTTSVTAFQFFYNVGSTTPSAVSTSTVAGYEDAEDSSPTPESVSGGINIYGNTEFSDKENLHNVTLQSAAADDINVANKEGDSVWTAVIDVTQSDRNTLVAVGTGSQSSAINHTILGANNGGIILVGENAVGDNYVQAGSVGTYLENLGGYATLLGGEGEDSIVAGAGDYVSGGSGTDYFYDNNGSGNGGGYAIQDYSISEGDVIVATKFSDNSNNMTAAQMIENVDIADSVIAITGSNAITVGGNAVKFSDSKGKDGETYNFAWAEEGGGTLDASDFTDKGAIILASQNGSAADYVVGTGDADTIFAGGNDTIDPGNGADEIYITEVTSESEEAGAVIVLSSSGIGRNEVTGFSFGFDNEDAGNSILDADVDSVGFGLMNSLLIATVGSNQMMFMDSISGNKYDILVGNADDNEKVSVLKGGSQVTISSNDDVADRYYGIGNSTLTFSADVTDELYINLGDSAYHNISRLAVDNENAAIILGSSGKDIVSLGGSSAADAHKNISLGAGDDVIYSGGEAVSTAGHAIYFGSSSGDGDDTIHNFGYYQGVADDPEKNGADVLILNGWDDNVSTITGSAIESEVVVALSTNNTVHIAGELDPDRMLRYSIDDGSNILTAKLGVSSGQTNTFTYDKEVTYYHGNTNRNLDTLTVDNSDANANTEIWLDGSKGVYYNGIGVIDASQAESTQLTLVGNGNDNTIISGGEGTTASLWGGSYGENLLIGGDGDDVFFFLNSSSSNTVSNFDAENDRVRLFDITLDMLVADNNYGLNSNGGIQIKTTGGATFELEGDGHDGAKFDVSNGDGSYTAYTATKNSDGSWSWENR